MGQIKNIKLHIVTDIKISIHLTKAIQSSSHCNSKLERSFKKRANMQLQAMMIYAAMLIFVMLLFVTQDVDAASANFGVRGGVSIGDEEPLSDALQNTVEELDKW